MSMWNLKLDKNDILTLSDVKPDKMSYCHIPKGYKILT